MYKVKNCGKVIWPENTKLFFLKDGQAISAIKMKAPVHPGESRQFRIRNEIQSQVELGILGIDTEGFN